MDANSKLMDNDTKQYLCTAFFDELIDFLGSKYEVIQSCNMDFSRYLVPVGTSDQISYYGKPDKSFRISDHWSWYSNTKKCADPNYIQCCNMDLPRAKGREDDRATKPIFAYQIAIIGSDGNYHAVYGEVYNKNKHEWVWKKADPKLIAEEILKEG